MELESNQTPSKSPATPSTKSEISGKKSSCYSIVTLKEWWDRNEHQENDSKNTTKFRSRTPLPLIDLRSDEEFQNCHLNLSLMNSLHDIDDDDDDRNQNIYSSGKRFKTDNSDDYFVNPTIVHLPFSNIISGERSCELPPRNIDFGIIVPSTSSSFFADGENEEANKATLKDILSFFFSTTSKATNQSRKSWKVKEIILNCEETWKDAKSLNILCPFGCANHYECSNRNNHYYRPLPRMWKPDEMIQDKLLPLLKCRIEEYMKQSHKFNHLNNHVPKLVIWDLGSGAGRDLCFLSEEMKFYYNELRFKLNKQQQHDLTNNQSGNNTLHPLECSRSLNATRPPFKFVGFDNHKGSARRCIPLWKNHFVDDITHACQFDLKKIDVLHSIMTEETISDINNEYKITITSTSSNQVRLDTCSASSVPKPSNTNHNHDSNNPPSLQYNYPKDKADEIIACIYCVRYLNRNLLKYIVSENNPLVSRGTIFAMSHFCKESEGSEWNFDHPKESNVLERDELQRLFLGSNSDDGTKALWNILQNEICFDGDHGRTLIHFVAIRK